MQPVSIKNELLHIRRLEPEELGLLAEYLSGLGEVTRKRFGPHPFDLFSLRELFGSQEELLGFIARSYNPDQILAYSVIKKGYLEHDAFRLRSYGLDLDPVNDCTFAPSVADAWQGSGLGSALFQYMLTELRKLGFKRIILWGGVQCNNLPALNFYRKFGFTILGEFEYHGMNYDMMRLLEEI